jgi:glutamine amidotransferase
MIKIIDINLGNPVSIKNAFKKIKIETEIVNNPRDIEGANGIILPGIGSFDEVMIKLKNNNWIDILNDKVLNKKTPILGICVGMQVMAKSSEEGILSGFGWIDAEVKKLSFPLYSDLKLPLPHMRWAKINIKNIDAIFNDPNENMRFYFVHGYHVVCNREENLISQIFYGDWFTASISRSNIYGVQFHPEKSHSFGQTVLKRFSKICI